MKSLLGQKAEQFAASYLDKNGYSIVTQNFHSRFGEIDIIAQIENRLIFVEVKARTNSKFGSPREAVNSYKLNKLIATANIFMKMNKFSGPYQVDVIEVTGDEGNFSAHHVKNVTL